MTDLFSKQVARLDEAAALRLSKLMTLGWAVVFIVFATLFENMQNPVVELGLSIASFTYGALLGAFLLGLAFRRVQEKEAMIAFVCSVVLMVVIIFGVWTTAEGEWIFMFYPSAEVKASLGLTSIAWPWFTALGTLITLGVGSLLSILHK